MMDYHPCIVLYIHICLCVIIVIVYVEHLYAAETAHPQICMTVNLKGGESVIRIT